METGDENEAKFAPTTKEEALQQISFDGLPTCPTEQIIDIIKSKYEILVKVFAHYCKYSDCATVEKATRLRLGARRSAARAKRPRGPPAAWCGGRRSAERTPIAESYAPLSHGP